jgi:glycosyltransferase involved in cell wall biosynthesis
MIRSDVSIPVDLAGAHSVSPMSDTSEALRPKLLAISPVPPWPAIDGLALRASRLLEELCKRWSIVLVCPSGGESALANGISLSDEIIVPRNSQWMFHPSQYDHEPLRNAVTEAIRVHNPALALLWGSMEFLRGEIPEMPRMVTDRVDCSTLANWRELFHGGSQATLRRRVSGLADAAGYEFRMRRASDATVVVGETDAWVLQRIFGVANVHVIPNGVDVPETIEDKRSLRPTVMFTGVMSFHPNIVAVMHFADEIWPAVRERIPEAAFQIVGRNPVPEILALASRPGIEVHADVESVHSYLARAWLAVAPMRTGAGIKNKILEAWSVGTPAVMTPIATNGLTQSPPELLLTGEGAELSALVVDLLGNPERRAELGALARSTALRTFSWKGQAAAVHALLQSAAAREDATYDTVRSDRA